MSRGGRRAATAAVLLLAGCQPLPHPFAEDRPPAALLKIRDGAGVSIAPIEGEPAAIASRLGPAVARALLKHDIPATDKTASLGSYFLYGRVVESRPRDGQASFTALWRLYDSQGRTIGEPETRLEGQPVDGEGASEAAIDRLASLSADQLAPLLADETPVKAAAEPSPLEENRIRVAIGKISGAPGDGARALAAAVASVLKGQDLAIVEESGKADLVIDGEIAVAPVRSDKQHVKIVWRVRRTGGPEIGTVGQENDVPRGLLDGAWGDLAYTVAVAAGDGLMQLVARGAPSRKS